MDILIVNNLHMVALKLCLMIVLFLTPWISHAETSLNISQKQKVNAAAIYKFINFIEWPENSLNNPSLTICLQQNEQAFTPFKNRRVQSKTLILKVISAEEAIDECNIIYMNATSNTNTRQLLSKFKHHAILTISDKPEFLQQGGMIQLDAKNNRLSFGINRIAAQQENINIAFQLLSLADTVIDN